MTKETNRPSGLVSAWRQRFSTPGSCLAVGFACTPAFQGITVDSLEFDLEGNLDLHGFLGLSQEIRPGFDGIAVKFRVKADAPPEKIIELCN